MGIPFLPAEVWRGGVNAWECDEMGHLNTRFYAMRAMEGLVVLMAEAGFPGAFSPKSPTIVLPREHHIRFLREARVSAPLHMTAGFSEIGDSTASAVLLLVHSQTGELAATFRMKLVHVAADEEETTVTWPLSFLARAASLRVELPKEVLPRSVGDNPVKVTATSGLARSLGVPCIARGAIGTEACDPFGRMQPQKFVGVVSDGIRQLTASLRDIVVEHSKPKPLRYGGAVLESRIIYERWPRCGDAFEVRSGLQGADHRTMSLVHWMLDPVTGGAWAAMQSIAIVFDLEQRRIVPISEAAARELAHRTVPRMAIGE